MTTYNFLTTSTKKLKSISLCLLLFSLSVESSAFGTVFTSPEQRKRIDQKRTQNTALTNALEISAPTQSQSNRNLFFNGYVVRKSGPGTAWVNHHMLSNENNRHNGMSANLRHIKGTSVPIKPAAETTVWIQPGQNYNLETGEMTESYSRTSNTIPANAKTKKPTLQSKDSALSTDDTDKSETGSLERE